MSIDEKDELILEELKKNARKPTKHIAESIDIPRVTVHTRIQKLIERNIIEKFTIITNYKKIGLPVTSFVFISTKTDIEKNLEKITEQIATIKNVYEVHLISGEWDILVKIRGKTIEEIGEIVIQKIRPINGVAKTITCPSFYEAKNEL